jgi:ribulose-phosphate 3-epimerase
MSRIRIAPSLLAADQSDLAGAVEALGSGADVLHIDVMDGHFVPNISMGPAVVEGVRPRSSLPIDVHLMVSDPDRWIDVYRAAGADWISAHAEATPHLERTVSHVRETGARAGVVLNPGTGFDGLEYVLHPDDFVLIMSVNPGFGGQRFLPRTVTKIAALRSFLDGHGLDSVEIEVDGGIDPDTVGPCAAAGATIFVAGSAITGQEDSVAAAGRIRSVAEAAVAGEA